MIYNPHQEHNLIGRPQARYDKAAGEELIRVNPDHPVIYYQTRSFSTPRGEYLNLIYRVHFPGTPFSLIPFLIGNGNNNAT